MEGAKPDLILHIGSEKTGTTSLQHFLNKNRARFLGRLIYIPDFLGFPNHRLAEYAFEEDSRDDGFSKKLGLFGDLPAKSRFKSETRSLIRAKAREYADFSWIISSEHFQSRLLTLTEIKALWDFLLDVFGTIKVIIYLRDPVQAAFSSLSTFVKAGGQRLSVGPPGQQFDHNCNHKLILSRWLEVIPRDCLTVRLFEKQMQGSDLLFYDFFDACRISYGNDLELPPCVNQSLSYPALKLLAFINGKIPRFINNSPNPVRGNIVKYLMGYFSGMPALLPSRGQVQEFDDYYRDSTDYIRAEFFPNIHGRLWSYPRVAEEAGDVDFSEELSRYEIEFAKLLCDCWSDKQVEILRLKELNSR